MSNNVGSRRPGSGSNSDSDSLSALLSSSWSDPSGKDMFAGSTSIRAVSLSLSVSGSGWLCLVRRDIKIGVSSQPSIALGQGS